MYMSQTAEIYQSPVHVLALMRLAFVGPVNRKHDITGRYFGNLLFPSLCSQIKQELSQISSFFSLQKEDGVTDPENIINRTGVYGWPSYSELIIFTAVKLFCT